jgi:hypothetical protein
MLRHQAEKFKLRVFPEDDGGGLIDPATTSVFGTGVSLEFRLRALSKFDHRGTR